MANHGYVKTRKVMRPEKISEILDNINKTHFNGNLKIDYHQSDDPSAWGPHTWLLAYVSNGQEWASRVCWLNTGRSFEMRHGGGTSFAWWMDTLITHSIAHEYDGTITDDGDDSKEKGNPAKYDTFLKYVDIILCGYDQSFKDDKEGFKRQFDWHLRDTPPEFKIDFKFACETDRVE